MTDLILMEIYKLKRSYIIFLSFLCATVIPILNLLMHLAMRSRNPEKIISFPVFMNNIFIFNNLIIMILISGLIVTYTFNREFEEDTLKSILTIPVSRTKLILAKLIMLVFWIVILNLITLFLGTALGLIFNFEGFNSLIFINNIKGFVICGFAIGMLSPQIILITLIARNFIPSLIFVITIVIANLFILSSKYMALFPWTLPYYLSLEKKPDVKTLPPLLYSYLSIIFTFIFFLILVIIYLNKKDITQKN